MPDFKAAERDVEHAPGGLWDRLRKMNKVQVAALGIGAATLVVGFLAWRSMQSGAAGTSSAANPLGLPTSSGAAGGGASPDASSNGPGTAGSSFGLPVGTPFDNTSTPSFSTTADTSASFIPSVGGTDTPPAPTPPPAAPAAPAPGINIFGQPFGIATRRFYVAPTYPGQLGTVSAFAPIAPQLGGLLPGILTPAKPAQPAPNPNPVTIGMSIINQMISAASAAATAPQNQITAAPTLPPPTPPASHPASSIATRRTYVAPPPPAPVAPPAYRAPTAATSGRSGPKFL